MTIQKIPSSSSSSGHSCFSSSLKKVMIFSRCPTISHSCSPALPSWSNPSCGRGVTGLGGWVYGFLSGSAACCAACCVYLSIRLSAFFVEIFLSSGIVLKGTWVLQVGLSLYTDAFGLKGCLKISEARLAKGEADVKCELDDDMWRGMALMSFMFVGHVVVIMVMSFVLFGLLSRYTNMRCGETSRHLLAAACPCIRFRNSRWNERFICYDVFEFGY